MSDDDALPFPPEKWKELPLKLRQRWWLETDYGRKRPTPELAATLREAVANLPKDAT